MAMAIHVRLLPLAWSKGCWPRPFPQGGRPWGASGYCHSTFPGVRPMEASIGPPMGLPMGPAPLDPHSTERADTHRDFYGDADREVLPSRA